MLFVYFKKVRQYKTQIYWFMFILKKVNCIIKMFENHFHLHEIMPKLKRVTIKPYGEIRFHVNEFSLLLPELVHFPLFFMRKNCFTQFTWWFSESNSDKKKVDCTTVKPHLSGPHMSGFRTYPDKMFQNIQNFIT